MPSAANRCASAASSLPSAMKSVARSRPSSAWPRNTGLKSTSLPRRLKIQARSSSDDTRCQSALCASIASRKRISFAVRATVAKRRGVRHDRPVRQPGPLGPGIIKQIEIGTHADPACRQTLLQRARGGEAEHLAIDTHHSRARERYGEPVDMWLRLAGPDFHQVDAGAGQLSRGLVPIAAVGPQSSSRRGNDQRARRAGEARQPFTALPARWQIFRQVRIGGRHDDRVDPRLRHDAAQAQKTRWRRGSSAR